MSDLSNAHDRFFKETFSRLDMARDFLAHYLPPSVTAVLDLSSLNLRQGSFVDPDLQEHFSDLLYWAELRGSGDAYVYLLLEHKSYPDPLTAFQLLRYMVRIWERDEREGEGLRPIIPMVVYHGQSRWQASTEFAGLYKGPEPLQPYWPNFRYQLHDLGRYSDEEIEGMVVAQVTLLIMKYIFDPTLRHRLSDIVSLLRELEDKETAVEHLLTVLRYVAVAGKEVTEQDMVLAVQATLPQIGGDIMQTLAEKWIEQGIEQGFEQGIEKGQVRTLQEAVLDLLDVRFGGTTVEIITAVEQLIHLPALRYLLRQTAVIENVAAFNEHLAEARRLQQAHEEKQDP